VYGAENLMKGKIEKIKHGVPNVNHKSFISTAEISTGIVVVLFHFCEVFIA
jgi:hypothetical protein